MQVIFNRSGTPTIHNVLLDTIDTEHGYVEITVDDNRHEFVEFESLYPYFINGQIAETRCGDKFIIIGEKHNVVLYNITSLEGKPINALNYNWDYTYYNNNGNRNANYDIMSFWKLEPTCNLADMLNGDYLMLTNRITSKFDEIRLKEDLI
jgi:hypothetical protein